MDSSQRRSTSRALFIEPPVELVVANSTGQYQRRAIYASNLSFVGELKWIIDVSADKLVADVGDASSGLFFVGRDAKRGVEPAFWLVYQQGKWAAGYAPQEGKFTYWQAFPRLSDPHQQFELTIPQDGLSFTLKNGQGFQRKIAMKEAIFAGIATIATKIQVAPQAKLSLHHLAVQYASHALPEEKVKPFAQPVAPAPMGGKPHYLFHVSPQGDDANVGSADKPFKTIGQAQAMVRLLAPTQQGAIWVYLHGGVHFLSEPLHFGSADSGHNGHEVIYRAMPNQTPILSGGRKVSGWSKLPDSDVWKAVLPADVRPFRQLYINGIRAKRAATAQPISGLRWAQGAVTDRDGIVIAGTSLPTISRAQELELHWSYDWKDMRLPVERIEQNGDGTKTIWLKQPYFSYALSMGAKGHEWYPKFDKPFYVEHGRELLNEVGEWYYNSASRELFYKPRPQEQLASAEVIIPQTERLMVIAGGNIGQEVRNLAFEGIHFRYGGWNRPSEVGSFGWQAQQLIDPQSAESTDQHAMPIAHVTLSSAKRIRFEWCRFEQLGGIGLHLHNNTFECTVRGNLFQDLSESAIVVGHWDHAYITAPALQAAPHHNLISNNLIHKVGVEYWGAPAITAYYVNHLQLRHNELLNLPYSGISLGWGWNRTEDSTTCHDNLVAQNLITDLLQQARDGGGIYTLGPQPGTKIIENVIRRVKADFATLYTDEGSAWITFERNVCDTAPGWLDVWIKTIHDLRVSQTFTNIRHTRNNGVNITIEQTTFVEGQAWPAAAQAIIQAAGLEPAYAVLRSLVR